jgi:hypothetical protein
VKRGVCDENEKTEYFEVYHRSRESKRRGEINREKICSISEMQNMRYKDTSERRDMCALQDRDYSEIRRTYGIAE